MPKNDIRKRAPGLDPARELVDACGCAHARSAGASFGQVAAHGGQR